MTFHIQLHRKLDHGVAHVESQVGRGGAASVASASMKTGDLVVEVALKVFQPNTESFKQEFAAMRALSHPFSHPHIIDFIGTSEMDERDVIVLPLMPKGSLDKFLQEHPKADRGRLVLQIGEALRYLHDDAGFVHGDIKCQNVLVNENGTAMLADFGQSVNLRVGSDAEPQGGTLRFTAPELLLGDGKPTTASDVYAFGSLIYQAFTGEVPWHNWNDMATTLEICSGHSPPYTKAVPAFFWDLSGRCWRFRPDLRPRMRDIVPRIRAHIGVPVPAWPIRVKLMTKHDLSRILLDSARLSTLAKVAWGGWRLLLGFGALPPDAKKHHVWRCEKSKDAYFYPAPTTASQRSKRQQWTPNARWRTRQLQAVAKTCGAPAHHFGVRVLLSRRDDADSATSIAVAT